MQVTIEVRNLTAKLLDVQIIPPPTALNGTVLRQLFTDLANHNLEVFNPTPDGGAVFSNPAQQRQVVVATAARQVVLPIQVDAARSLDEVIEIFNLLQARAQAPVYLACAVTITAHLPVTGESATELLRRKTFQNPEAYDALGPGIQGVGLRVFMASSGPFSFSVEPLLADPGRIVVQLQQVIPGIFQLNELRGICERVVQFYDNQIRNFLDQLLADH